MTPSSIDFESIHFQSRSMSDPPQSDIDVKNKTAWVKTTLKMKTRVLIGLHLIQSKRLIA